MITFEGLGFIPVVAKSAPGCVTVAATGVGSQGKREAGVAARSVALAAGKTQAQAQAAYDAAYAAAPFDTVTPATSTGSGCISLEAARAAAWTKALASGNIVREHGYALSALETEAYNKAIDKAALLCGCPGGKVTNCKATVALAVGGGAAYGSGNAYYCIVLKELMAGKRPFMRFVHPTLKTDWGVFYDSSLGVDASLLEIKPAPKPWDFGDLWDAIKDIANWVIDKCCALSKGLVGDAIYGAVGALAATVATGGMGAAAGAKAGMSAQEKVASWCGVLSPDDAPPLDTSGPALVAELTEPPPDSTLQLKYAGATARWHVGEQVWWMYFPRGLFGEDAPLPDAKEPGTPVTPPAGSIVGPPIEPAPIYTKAWFWAVVGGGVLVLGTGGYFLLRKKRS
jgi:hypothetical protein